MALIHRYRQYQAAPTIESPATISIVTEFDRADGGKPESKSGDGDADEGGSDGEGTWVVGG